MPDKQGMDAESFFMFLANGYDAGEWPAEAFWDDYGTGLWIAVPDGAPWASQPARELHHVMTPANWFYVDISGWQAGT